MPTDIQILDTPLDLNSCTNYVQHSECGGTAVFIGTVRNQTEGKIVIGLEFEAYIPMAIKELNQIAIDIGEKWNATSVCMHHRIGSLDVGETAVIIAVSAPHRAAAFQACAYAIDTLKQTVPIWKKELYENGSVWVSAHP